VSINSQCPVVHTCLGLDCAVLIDVSLQHRSTRSARSWYRVSSARHWVPVTASCCSFTLDLNVITRHRNHLLMFYYTSFAYVCILLSL